MEKAPHRLFRLVGGVLDDPMADIGEPHHVGVGPFFDEPRQATGVEAPVAFAPDEERRQVGHLREFPLDRFKRLPRWVAVVRGDVANELVDRRAAPPGVVGGEIPGADCGFEAALASESHREGCPREGIGSLYHEPAEDGAATGTDPPRDEPGAERAGVEQDDSLEPFTLSQERAEADGAAPILGDQCDAAEVERLEEVPLTVVKRSGDREPFDRAKVISGLEAATKARPVERYQLDDLALAVEESVRLEGSEVSTEVVGRAVLDLLRGLDAVAAVRFASVYKEFDDLADFERELTELTRSTPLTKATRPKGLGQ